MYFCTRYHISIVHLSTSHLHSSASALIWPVPSYHPNSSKLMEAQFVSSVGMHTAGEELDGPLLPSPRCSSGLTGEWGGMFWSLCRWLERLCRSALPDSHVESTQFLALESSEKWLRASVDIQKNTRNVKTIFGFSKETGETFHDGDMASEIFDPF